MNIDWAVAIGIFLVFVVWAFTFYANVFTEGQESVITTLDSVSTKVIDNLSIRMHTVPFNFEYGGGPTTVNIYFTYAWPFGRNTTEVFSGSGKQFEECYLQDNDNLTIQLYLSTGTSYYELVYSDRNETVPRCSEDVSGGNESHSENITIFATEERTVLSLSAIQNLSAVNYTVLKQRLGISRDFNITITNATTTFLDYGRTPPALRDVFGKTVLTQLEETRGNVTVRFLSW